MTDKPFVIWGSSGHAKVLLDILAAQGASVVALVDQNAKAIPVVSDAWMLRGRDDLQKFVAEWTGARLNGAAAIGGARGDDRQKVLSHFRALGLSLPCLLHETASISPSAKIGDGSHVLARSVVAADCKIGEACIVNNGAVVDHESTIKDGSHVAPGATLCGCVTLEERAFVGAGATVLPRTTVGSGSIVGAGAVVTKDVPPGAVWAGVPAGEFNPKGRSL